MTDTVNVKGLDEKSFEFDANAMNVVAFQIRWHDMSAFPYSRQSSSGGSVARTAPCWSYDKTNASYEKANGRDLRADMRGQKPDAHLQ